VSGLILASRRQLLTRALGASALLTLSGCDRLSQSTAARHALANVEDLDSWLQRHLMSRRTLAREYSTADISRQFRANGSIGVDDPDYIRLAQGGFADWRLTVDGLVERPLSLSLEELRALPTRTQITCHDCVEGWSCVGQWTGVRLSTVLQMARLRPLARYIVFHCADALEQTLDGTGQYYESIDLIDAFHPQTILAYDMNGSTLPIAHGAPLRLRVERQLGYKMAKYVMRIEALDSFSALGRGRGGFWEDRGYEWYAGI
jgi:DMSO/TMAO reductase YedYZ molybdopterin-dependent catalytic subunit